MDYLLAAIVGVGLAAACGLRAFVPVLAVALAAKAGWLELGETMGWLGSWPAIAALLLACIAEISGSLIPAVNHALDALAAPVATVAGGIVMASQIGSVPGLPEALSPEILSVDPMLTWGASLIAGGGVAALVHTGSATARAGSTAVSGGLLSPVYGAAESAMSVLASVLAFVVPVLFAIAVGAVLAATLFGLIWWMRRRSARRTGLGYHSKDADDAEQATRRSIHAEPVVVH
jgi:hypothetical protein